MYSSCILDTCLTKSSVISALLIHWGRVTFICVSNLTIIGSYNGLSPCRRQAIFWINAGILLIRNLGTNFSEILCEIHTFSSKKMYFKMWFAKWRQISLGLNALSFSLHSTSSALLETLHPRRSIMPIPEQRIPHSLLNGISMLHSIWCIWESPKHYTKKVTRHCMSDTGCLSNATNSDINSHTSALNQIRKIVSCACAGNAGNVFPPPT